MALDITPAQHDLLLKLLRQYLPNVAIWAFGSRVKGTARTTSDLDIVAFTTPSRRVFDLKEAFEDSALPFKVDLLLWDELPENFKKNIQGQYIELLTPK